MMLAKWIFIFMLADGTSGQIRAIDERTCYDVSEAMHAFYAGTDSYVKYAVCASVDPADAGIPS